ncbi:solute carrier family 22 member 15-like [Exaiptasia diaphana]|uniref:Major facilitator superfamily (MFS) profile domain-containing protein n=1 Tax=Exaiptasia diaphana TaxID=2652724 RepID=A0A913XAH7_EXADI|nr:solute carrier family 22 member 15-like [Exaiptasia diaphana]KXJ26655.1 Solute carrier family 22 member 15-like [Exaiptasia diaphana]
MEFDAAVAKIGEFGRYQRIQYLVANICSIPLYFQSLLGVFIAAQPKWKCVGQTNEPLCLPNGKICSKPQFVSQYSSIVTEWNLVCGDAYKAELAQSILMAGFLVGAFSGGYASDRYGRKRVWLTALVMNSVLGILCAFSPTLNAFYGFRFLQGVFIQSGTMTTFVISTEMIGPSYRGSTGMYVSIFAALSYPVLAFLASIFTNWRTLILITVAPPIASLFLAFLVSESPRWLLTVGRVSEAEEIINEAARVNGLPNAKITLTSIVSSGRKVTVKTSGHSILSIFTKRSLRTITMVMMVSFMASGIGYFGLSLNVRNLGGSVYWNFALFGIVEIPSYIMAAPILEALGRRKTNFLLTLSGGIACLICMQLQQTQYDSPSLVNAIALLGKFCVSAANALIYIYAAELFPTVIRNMAIGVFAVCIRLGAITAPFIVLLGNENKSIPMQVFSCITLLAAFLGLKLPETSGRPLPQTFEDLHADCINK